MTDLDYLAEAEALLRAVELACDDLNERTTLDVDNQRVGGMITLVFADGSQAVLNLQKPLHEVWLASRLGGQHFRFDGQVWRDTKLGSEFFASLSQAFSAHCGQSVTLGA